MIEIEHPDHCQPRVTRGRHVSRLRVRFPAPNTTLYPTFLTFFDYFTFVQTPHSFLMPFLRILRSTVSDCPRFFPDCTHSGPTVDLTSGTDSSRYDPTSQLGISKARDARNDAAIEWLGVTLIVVLLLILLFMWIYFTKTTRLAVINWFRKIRGKEPRLNPNGWTISRPTLVSSTEQLPPIHTVPSLSYSPNSGSEAHPTILLPARAFARPPKVFHGLTHSLSKVESSGSGTMSRQESKSSTTGTTEPARDNTDMRAFDSEPVAVQASLYQGNKAST